MSLVARNKLGKTAVLERYAFNVSLPRTFVVEGKLPRRDGLAEGITDYGASGSGVAFMAGLSYKIAPKQIDTAGTVPRPVLSNAPFSMPRHPNAA